MVESGIFKAAVKLPPERRAAYLEQACGANQELRQEVESLLRAHDRGGSFLEDQPAGPDRTRDYEPITERPGTVIGHYKLMEQIGEGGMGLVFVADQQEPVRRRVALKIIKPGMDTREVIARFEAERQALALMDHPNIARVFDAGTTASGRPYFVMELVKGIPIIDYCDQQELTARKRLELFLSVCHAVQHAHGKGIIHRDLKPSNILVAPHDGVPVVKVIDFGVAKAIGQQLTEKTIYTRFTQMIGTPLYMSPEQAEINALDVDIRSDIYSLGVLLYELLTGTTPFTRERFATAAYDEIRRIIREEDPPKPSTRLSSLGATLAAVSARRKTEPAKLTKSLRGELDSIVMKALEKDRNRRFATALELAADIERHLTNEPVLACPPSLGYRLKKFTRKHRGPITAATAVLAALVLGLVSTTLLYFKADAAKRSEAAQRLLADQRRSQAEHERENAKVAEANAKREADRADASAKRARRLLYVSHMNLAQAAWEDARVARVSDLLNQHEPQPGEEDLRGFEWYYWNRLAHSYQLNLEGHSAGVTGVAFSPDGKRLASASLDTTVKVWDAMNGQETLTLKADINLLCVALSPDGLRLASGSIGIRIPGSVSPGYPAVVKVWDATSGQELHTLKGHVGAVNGVAFSPDGKRLASASDDETVKVWDTATGQESLTLKGHTGGVNSVAFSPDGQRLASASGETVKVWDATSGQEILTLIGHTNGVTSVAFSPDGKRLASASWDETVKVWDATSGPEILTLIGHTGVVKSVAFSEDGKRLASASWDQTVKMWDVMSGQETLTLKGYNGMVLSVAFTAQGKRLASAGDGWTVKVWDMTSANEPLSLNGHTGSVDGVVFSPDGQRLVSASSDRTLKVWDATSGVETVTLRGHTSAVHGVAFSPDGQRLASAGGEYGQPGEVKLWDAATGHESLTLKGHTGSVRSVAFTADGKRLASAGDDGTIKVWDPRSGQEMLTLKGHTSGVTCVAFSPDGNRLASSSDDGAVMLWDAATGRKLLTLKEHRTCVASVAFCPDGKRLALASRDRTVTVSDAKLWEHAAQMFSSEMETYFVKGKSFLDDPNGEALGLMLEGHTNGVTSVAFSPDGKRLASASSDGTVKVWDVTSGQELLTLKGDIGHVTSVAFSTDGKRLASAGDDGTVKVWDARPWTQELRTEQEALSLVRFYSTPPIPKDELLARIRADATVGERARGRALELAQRVRENPQALAERGLAYAHLKQWDRAAADSKEAVQLQPDDPELLCQYAAVLLLSEDVDSFHKVLGDAWRRFAETTEPRTKYLMARIATMSPSRAPEPARVVALAEEAVASDPKAAWYLHTLGIAHYRADQFDQAVRRLHESMDVSPEWPAHVDNWLALAMTHQRLGDAAEARQWLDKATQWLEHATEEGHGKAFDDLHPHDWLTCLLLLREAKSLLNGEAP